MNAVIHSFTFSKSIFTLQTDFLVLFVYTDLIIKILVISNCFNISEINQLIVHNGVLLSTNVNNQWSLINSYQFPLENDKGIKPV